MRVCRICRMVGVEESDSQTSAVSQLRAPTREGRRKVSRRSMGDQ